jgi:hypothetical protein
MSNVSVQIAPHALVVWSFIVVHLGPNQADSQGEFTEKTSEVTGTSASDSNMFSNRSSALYQQPPPAAAVVPGVQVPPIVQGGGGKVHGPPVTGQTPFVTILPQLAKNSLQGDPACFLQNDNVVVTLQMGQELEALQDVHVAGTGTLHLHVPSPVALPAALPVDRAISRDESVAVFPRKAMSERLMPHTLTNSPNLHHDLDMIHSLFAKNLECHHPLRSGLTVKETDSSSDSNLSRTCTG